MNDYKLIKQIKQGDSVAVERAIGQYGGYVYTIVRNILGNSMQQEDIEETVADVFLKLWKNSESLDESRPLKPYLVGMARNTAKNKLREKRCTDPLDDSDIPVEIELDDNLSKKEQITIVHETLNALNQADKETFIRFYYNYERIHEISVALGLSESAVKMKLHRTRSLLLKALNERGYVS